MAALRGSEPSNREPHPIPSFLRVSLCILGFLGTHSVAQAGLELTVFLPQPPECWGYRRELPYWLHDEIMNG